MKLFAIEPHDGLTFRTGAGADGSNFMRTLAFPWPSSTAGALRTAAGSDENGAFTAKPEEALTWRTVGPLLLARKREEREWSLPRDLAVLPPADAVFFTQPGAGDTALVTRHRLRPSALREGELTDLDPSLRVVGFADASAPEGKPGGAPAFWRWSELEKWLVESALDPNVGKDFGFPALTVERRTHVALNENTRTAKDGALFSAELLRFRDTVMERALLCGIDGARELKPRTIILGGERRSSSLAKVHGELPRAPKRGWTRSLRVVLLTPAFFKQGAVPSQIHGATVVAACVGRPITISGWDMTHVDEKGRRTGRPKPTRRAAPAGSVYWVELPAAKDPQQWVEEVWMNPISEELQDRIDGFGLAVVGVE